MKIQTKKDFFQVLKKSRLLTPDERVAAKEAAQGISEPAAIARRLVDSNQLTRWQASQLLGGKTKFFLGKYKLLKVCGRGGMGMVFKAEQPGIDRPVAIKVLHRSLLSKPRAVSRFQREMRLAGSLNHPNLVVAYDADQVRDNHYLVMEYVAGKSLKYYIQKHGRMPIGWSCECIRQAALGLAHVHERGLVHRDIKPSNLLVVQDSLSKTPKIKILDVGLSRFVSESDEDDGLTKAGQILGTMDYMAPEQIKDARAADIRADIYSLGATLFQLLTGNPPLAGKTLMQTYMARMTEHAPPVGQFRSGIPATLDGLVARMLERDHEKRCQTPNEVAEELAVILDNAIREPHSRIAREESEESGSPNLSLSLSTDEESEVQLESTETGLDKSLVTFLDQLSQDEPTSQSSLNLNDSSFAAYLSRKRSGFSWRKFVNSASNWVKSLFPSRKQKFPAEYTREADSAPSARHSAVRPPQHNSAHGDRKKKLAQTRRAATSNRADANS